MTVLGAPAVGETLLHALSDFRLWAVENDESAAAQLSAPAYLFPQVVPMGATGVKSQHPHALYWLCYRLAQKVFVELVEPVNGGRQMRVAHWLCDEEGWGAVELTNAPPVREMKARLTNNCIVQRNLCGYSPTGDAGVFVVGERPIPHELAVATDREREWPSEGGHRHFRIARL